MPEQPDAPQANQAGFVSRLSLPMLALVGVVVSVGVGAGGYYAYQTYDYVQHDNDFCMSCHLMQQPYELFAESAHQGLGCKACHQPTFLARSQMALTQILENPEELSVHAEVPNERCTECHIDGDPQKWRLIENSVGHQVHFESEEPALEGLKCVECHSTSIHEFAPIDRTCAQSGCHEDNTIQLGGMSDLTIHCAACHTFVAPVVDEEAVVKEGGEQVRTAAEAAILPDRSECLSCHEMRVLVDLPDPDPHDGVCSYCHNPHEQEVPAQAVESCATAGCHQGVADLTPFHRGMGAGILEDCLACHQAHDFAVDGTNCVNCHQSIADDDPSVVLPRDEATDSTVAGSGGIASGAHLGALHAGVAGVGIGWWVHPQQVQEGPQFRHSEHRDVECGNCHVNTLEHGELSVRTLGDCRQCHHTAPVSRSCDRCHEGSDVPDRTFEVTSSVSFSVGTSDPSRRMVFPHASHTDIDCATCHTQGLGMVAVGVDCASCHEDHHDPGNECASCHVAAPTSAHPPEQAHVTCSGAGCHEQLPFDTVPRTRQTCLGCHQDLQDHRPGRACAECHTLPSPRNNE